MELYPYQKEYLAGMPKNIIMTAEVGTGKTIMALEHYERHNEANPLIIVAPATKVRTGDWERELKAYVTLLPIRYTIISYEMFTKRWRDLVNNETTIIADECHMACNATTKRGKAMIQATALCKQWIFLSATPLPNGWRSAETYAIVTGLSRNKTAFVQRFERIDRRRGFPLLLGYNEESVLNDWWDKISRPLRRTGDLKLPSENIPVYAQMPSRTHTTYRRALKERLYRSSPTDDDEFLDNPSKLFARLRQIPTLARIESLENILNDTDEHTVVFYNYNIEREAILELLAAKFKERKIYEQSGHASNLPPRDRWDKLKPSVTLVQYQSGSAAIELTYASITVYLSPCTSYANYEQSKGRTRRNGQRKTTLFYHIAVKDTLDPHIWGLLKKKQSFSEHMFSEYIANITT